jgi:phosphoglycerate dehydrogenase-like enzyme
MVLVNIGRGAIIDEDALVEELLSGEKIAGAALDVFQTEPLPQSSRLWSLSNILISPHNADYLCDSRHKSVRLFTEYCRKFLAGEELSYYIDKESGY